MVIVTLVFSLPHNALAFESNLSVSTSKALVANVYLTDRDSTLVLAQDQLPVDGYTRSAAVASYPSPETEKGDWPKQPVRVASATATSPQTLIAPISLPEPSVGAPVVLEGEASFYSRAGCLGCSPALTMANGQPLNDDALTMAIGADKKHLVGRAARVTNLVTGQSVNVTITDTGGFYQAKYGHRVADLTIATKNAIGMAGGVGQVRVEVY